MLKRIHVSAFKSLVDFELELEKFNCIIGLNGSGKSTVLQFLSYVSTIFRGDLPQWLARRNWESKDVVSHFFPTRKSLELEIDFEFDNVLYLWTGTFNWSKGICTKEKLVKVVSDSEHIEVYRVVNGVYASQRSGKQEINFKYSGSILSALNEDVIPHDAKRLRNYLINIESHDLLSPKVMRSGQYSKEGRLGSAGEFLIHHIHNLDDSDKDILRIRLSKYFPKVTRIETKALISGMLSMDITERYFNDDGNYNDVVTDARHINDGMLRLLNILANQDSNSGFQLFDEVENGVNPEVTEQLMDSFVDAPHQTLVTTHSPMALNYLNEDIAKSSVVLIYKKKNGHTASTKLFSVPSALNKLDILAPGEVMVDLYLSDVADEVESIRQANESRNNA